MLLLFLDVAKLPQATKLYAGITADGVHILEMLHQAHLERGGGAATTDNNDDLKERGESKGGDVGGKDDGTGKRVAVPTSVPRSVPRSADEAASTRLKGGGESKGGGGGGKGGTGKRVAVSGSVPRSVPRLADEAASRSRGAATDHTANPRAGRTSRAGGEAETAPTHDAAVVRGNRVELKHPTPTDAAVARGDREELGEHPTREYGWQGRALLPRFSAADFEPVLQGQPPPPPPPPFAERMAKATEFSVDETVDRAAGRPWRAPRSRGEHVHRRRAKKKERRGRCCWKDEIIFVLVVLLFVDKLLPCPWHTLV